MCNILRYTVLNIRMHSVVYLRIVYDILLVYQNILFSFALYIVLHARVYCAFLNPGYIMLVTIG